MGFHATTDMLAVFTTIAGAAVGANLTLITLDIAWDRRARDRFAATEVSETLEVRPA